MRPISDIVIAGCTAFAWATTAFAQPSTAPSTQPVTPVRLSAELGFAGVFKPDTWTPIYVRITDTQRTRVGTLEVRTARGRVGHAIEARVVSGSTPVTYTLYAPLGTLDRVVVQWRDEAGQLIESLDLSDRARQTPAAFGGTAVGVSGDPASARRVVNGLIRDTAEYVAAGEVAARLLPERPIGYASIDLLVLAGLDTDTLDDRVESAILAWVRSGGVVVAWPGSQQATTDSPLRDVLPASIGDVTVREVDGTQVALRSLQPTLQPGVADLSGDGTIFRRRIGLGQIVLCAYDPSLVRGDPAASAELWRRLTSRQFPWSADDLREGVFDPSITQARGEEQLTSVASGAGDASSQLSAWLWAALLVGLVLGPAEVAAALAARRHPWTSFSMVGVGLVGVATVGLLVLPRDRAPDASIAVTGEAEDGTAVQVTIASTAAVPAGSASTRPADGGARVPWLAAGTSDPQRQAAGELRMGQRTTAFEPLAPVMRLGNRSPAVRSVRFVGSEGVGSASTRAMRTAEVQIVEGRTTGRVANDTAEAWSQLVVATPTHLWRAGIGVPAGQTIDLAATAGAVVDADDAATRRRETGLERLAIEAGWESILMDRALATRLVRLQEIEGATVIAARTDDERGPRYVLHIVRRDP